MEIKLGQQAKDMITNFEGILIGKAEYIFGCTQYAIAPQVYNKEKGEISSTQWFDEGRIEIIGAGINQEEVIGEKPGGPNRDMP